jgi:hypothetical protein
MFAQLFVQVLYCLCKVQEKIDKFEFLAIFYCLTLSYRRNLKSMNLRGKCHSQKFQKIMVIAFYSLTIGFFKFFFVITQT